jgi:hypothetical protein
MNSAVPTLPARILKRASLDAGLASPIAPDVAVASGVAERAPVPYARHFPKEARLVPGTPGTAAVEVRCSCGEWTRIDLRLGDDPTPEA